MGGKQVWLDSDGSVFEKMGDIDADYLAWFIWEFADQQQIIPPTHTKGR